MIKLWTPETVYYAGDVVAYSGGTFQAKRDTGQPPSHADWMCLATAGRDGKTIAVRGTFDQSASYRRLDVVALNGRHNPDEPRPLTAKTGVRVP